MPCRIRQEHGFYFSLLFSFPQSPQLVAIEHWVREMKEWSLDLIENSYWVCEFVKWMWIVDGLEGWFDGWRLVVGGEWTNENINLHRRRFCLALWADYFHTWSDLVSSIASLDYPTQIPIWRIYNKWKLEREFYEFLIHGMIWQIKLCSQIYFNTDLHQPELFD